MQSLEHYVAKARLLSDQITREELRVILRELSLVLAANVEGDVVEFGCFVGTTSVHLQKILVNSRTPYALEERQLWLYDSFAGLPPKRTEDESPVGLQFQTGELHATKSQLIKNFKLMNVPLPRIKKAWFSELTAADVPDKIAFAFLDGDYYDSILSPLRLIWPRLTPGAVVVIDDYTNEALPGARRAVGDWLMLHSARLHSEASLAIVKK